MKIFELNEADITTGKLTDVKPGAEATIDMGDGTKTVVDLKKNPTALVKSPDGKVMFNKSGMTSGGVQPEQPDPTSMFKPGEPVTITSTQTENLDQNQDTFYFFDVARGAHSYRDQDLIDMGLKKSRSGKWYYRPRRSESEMSLRGKINRLEKILNIKAKIWKPELHELSIEAKPVDDQDYVNENLRKWFQDKWVRFGPDGKIRGECGGKDDSEGKPKCLPASKAHALGKKGRASAGARKRREDPNPDRSGAAINVATKKNEDAAMDQKPGRFNQAHQDLYKRNTPRFGGDSGMPGAQDIRQGTGSTVDRSGNPIGGLAVGVAKPGGVPKVSKIPVTRFGMAGTRDHDPKLGADLDPKSLMKNYDKDKIDEKWSEKYKRSIDCDNPRGFSQRAHCQGRDKNEAVETLDEKCWDTHKQVGMKRKGDRMVPNCVPREDVQEQQQMCPECGGAMYEASLMNEKKDACYYKVKSRYKVWPSAYASGALVKCRKKGAKNWGSKSESMAEGGFDIPEIPRAPTPKPPKQPGVAEGFDELAAYMKAAMAPRPRGDAGIKRGTYGQPGRRRGRPVGATGGEGSNIPHAVDFDRPHSERSAGRRLPRFSDDHDATRRSDVDENSARDKLHRRHQELRKKSGLPDPDYYKEFARSYDIEDDKQRMAVQAEIKRKYKVK